MCIFLSSCKTPHQAVIHHQHNRGNSGGGTANSSAEINSGYKTYAEKLGVHFNGSEDLSLLRCVAGWLGAPYKYGGCTKQGTDCSGMVSTVFDEVYHIKMYRSSADQLKNVREITISELKAGDLVFFKIYNNQVSHVAIYLGENKFIHASTQKGVIISSLDEEYYKKHYFVSGRVVGIK